MDVNQIITGDVRNCLDDLPDDSIDCVVTSPPYWGVRDYKVDDQLGVEDKAVDYIETLTAIGRQIRRVLDGSLWLNIADTYNGNSIIRPDSMGSHADKGDSGYTDQLSSNRAESGVKRRSSQQFGISRQSRLFIPSRVAARFAELGYLCRDEVIWNKPHPKPEGRVDSRLRRSHEKIYRFATGENVLFDREQIQTADVWTVDTERDADHPAPFPVEIPRRAIKATTSPGDTVLDPFCGSGTTLRAAVELNREYIGIELNEQFAELARIRCGSPPKDPANVRADDDQQGLEAYADDPNA